MDAQAEISGSLGKADWGESVIECGHKLGFYCVLSSGFLGCFFSPFLLFLCYSSLPVVDMGANWEWLGAPSRVCSTTAADNATHILLR